MVIVNSLKPPSELSPKELEIWNKGINPKIWESSTRTEKHRLKNRFNQLCHREGYDIEKEELIKSVDEQWSCLMNDESRECNVLNDLQLTNTSTLNIEIDSDENLNGNNLNPIYTFIMSLVDLMASTKSNGKNKIHYPELIKDLNNEHPLKKRYRYRIYREREIIAKRMRRLQRKIDGLKMELLFPYKE